MKNYTVIPLISKPGIQRDGTPFASQSYIGGQWCRFILRNEEGKPRKIGGYKLIDPGNTEIIRNIFSVLMPNSIDVYIGRASTLMCNTFDYNGNSTGETNRTPVISPNGFQPNVNNVWDFDLFTNDQIANPDLPSSYIVAQVAPNASDSSSTINGNLFYGDINEHTIPLVQIFGPGGPNDPVQVSGGIVFSPPVLVAYGNDGLIRWSAAGDITTWPDDQIAIIDNTKIIKAYRSRGGTGPIILAWTLSSLISLAYTSTVVADVTIPSFSATTIQNDITVMSPDSIVQYEQLFFWVGIDQFYFYGGTVSTLPNTMSSDWFFNNVNLSQRSKVWGMVLPRYKEIWWHYPSGTSTECNAVIIYNTELKVWYDSIISRSCGLSPSTFPYPLMCDSQTIANNYGIWMHEYQYDQFYLGNIVAIPSFFETHIMTLFNSDPNQNRLMRSRRIEPDFVQSGDMTVIVNNGMYASDSSANGRLISNGPYTFDGNTRKIDDVNSQGRLVSFVFSSDIVGGYYELGKTLLDFNIGDVRT